MLTRLVPHSISITTIILINIQQHYYTYMQIIPTMKLYSLISLTLTSHPHHSPPPPPPPSQPCPQTPTKCHNCSTLCLPNVCRAIEPATHFLVEALPIREVRHLTLIAHNISLFLLIESRFFCGMAYQVLKIKTGQVPGSKRSGALCKTLTVPVARLWWFTVLLEVDN